MTAVMASLLEIIDSSIVNVAIPHMQGNLGVTLQEVTWVSTGYIISNAVVLPIASWLGVKIGRKTYYTTCILLFTLTSLMCALAPNFVFLVISRVIQGIAGGALLPTSQTIIQEQFPGERSGTGSAIYGVSVMVGPAIGPTLGGYLTDHFNWRAIFFINIPIGIVAAALSYFFIEDQGTVNGPQMKKRRMDALGFSLLVVGIGALQFALERGQQDDWFNSNLILTAAVLAAVALPVFYAWEFHHKNPIVNVKLFKESAVRGGTLLMAATGMVLYSVIFLVPVYTANSMGMDATHTGLLYLPGTLVTMATMPFVGKFLPKLGPKFFITVGILCTCTSLYKLSLFSPSAGAPDLLSAFYWRAVGLGCIFVPVNSMVLSQYTGETLGQVSGLMNLSRQLGGSVGIAAMSTYLDRFAAQIRNDLRSHITSVNPNSASVFSRGNGIAHQKLQTWVGTDPSTLGHVDKALGGLAGVMGQMEKQAFQLSFNRLVLIIMLVYVLTLFPLARLQLKKKVSGPVSAE